MLSPFQSQLIVDVGIAFGDEGKGRLVYELVHDLRQQTGKPDPVEMVLKVNGGANSGHTAGGLKLNLLPGGVIDKSVRYLGIGSGVVADPRKLNWETASTEAKGYRVRDRLRIDERTMVSDLSHRLLDLAWETYRQKHLGEAPRGSTGRGITPAFGDEVAQWQLFYSEFLGPRDLFAKRLRARFERALHTIEHVCRVEPSDWFSFFETLTQAETRANEVSIHDRVFPPSEFDFRRFSVPGKPFAVDLEAIEETYWNAGRAWERQIVDLREMVLDLTHRKKYLIAEFGQSFWLDKRHGFSPNVTASHTFTPELFQSAGIPVQPVHTLGVAKAYDTKVGTHLFLTRFETGHPIGDRLAKIEFGTSTGRQRMVGWFDAVEKGTALRYGGFDDLVINKLDALGWEGDPDTIPPLKIAIAYRAPDGTLCFTVPRDASVRADLVPVYCEVPGWTENIRPVRKYTDLPAAARCYVATLLAATLRCAEGTARTQPPHLNLRYIGVGPDPDEIISDIPPVSEILGQSLDLESWLKTP